MDEQIVGTFAANRFGRRRALALAGGAAAAAVLAGRSGATGSRPDSQAVRLPSDPLVIPAAGDDRRRSARDVAWYFSEKPQPLAAGPRPPDLSGSVWQGAGHLPANQRAAAGGEQVASRLLSLDRQAATRLLRPALVSPASPAGAVSWSWNRFAYVEESAAERDDHADLPAPLRAMLVPDDRTVIVKLREPIAQVQALLEHAATISPAQRSVEGHAPVSEADRLVLTVSTPMRRFTQRWASGPDAVAAGGNSSDPASLVVRYAPLVGASSTAAARRKDTASTGAVFYTNIIIRSTETALGDVVLLLPRS